MPDFEPSNPRKFHCPYCGGRHLQAVCATQFFPSVEVRDRASKQGDSVIVAKCAIRYWCCPDCGNAFPFPQDLKQESENKIKLGNFGIFAGVFFAIMGIAVRLMFMRLAKIHPYAINCAVFPVTFIWSCAIVSFVPSAFARKASKILYAEYEKLLPKCTE